MVITDNNELFVTGNNRGNRLGSDTMTDVEGFTKVSKLQNVILASCGSENNGHCFVYTVNHELYASGYNYAGNLGDGKSTYNYDETFVLEKIHPKFIRNKDDYITKIECGESWSLFLTKYGVLYSCGFASNGHESRIVPIPAMIDMNNDKEPIIDVTSGYYHNLALDKKGRLLVWGENHHGQIGARMDITATRTPLFHEYFREHDIRLKSIDTG